MGLCRSPPGHAPVDPEARCWHRASVSCSSGILAAAMKWPSMQFTAAGMLVIVNRGLVVLPSDTEEQHHPCPWLICITAARCMLLNIPCATS